VSENYMYSTGSPNLKIGKINEKHTCFDTEILTKSDALEDEVLVEKIPG
jgi:hypothetical protein